MSAGDQQAATSFGDPNARPPTPEPTPTGVLSSPLLQTPRQNSSHFDETSGWTPGFAEEYSVFNSTPGNLKGAVLGRVPLNHDFAPLSPVAHHTGKKRRLSTEGVTLDNATRASHLEADPATLTSVDSASRLPSSTGPQASSRREAVATPPSTAPGVSESRSEQQQDLRTTKKSRKSSASGIAGKSPSIRQGQTQTATPPPSSGGGRKLAPKPQASIMQNQGFQEPGFSSAPPPHLNTAFVASNPEDVFGYPLGPATAPPVSGTRPFWGFDMNSTPLDTSGMSIDIDLAAAGADLFQTPTQRSLERPMSSMEWGRANFQQTSAVQLPDQQQQQLLATAQHQEHDAQHDGSVRRERLLAPKATDTPGAGVSQSPSQNFSFESFQMMDNPYNTSPGGVDPGLLFGQPTSSAPMGRSAMSVPMASSSQPLTSPALGHMAQTTAMEADHDAQTASVTGSDLQRSSSLRQAHGPGQQHRKLERAPAISPTKSAPGRPNLSRSFSESSRGGQRARGGSRNTLPVLAPAKSATTRQPNQTAQAASQGSHRPDAQGVSSGAGGRVSPAKPSQAQVLSSLTSIPENAANMSMRSRSTRSASVKFVIDENGRAHTETVVSDDDSDNAGSEPVLRSSGPRRPSHAVREPSLPLARPSHDSDEENSSSDDEPIIIPSRNTSFNFPDPPKSSGSGSWKPPTANTSLSQSRQGHRSVSDRPLSSAFRGSSRTSQDKMDFMDIDQVQPQRPSTGSSLGDAAAELRKVMQAVNPRQLAASLGSSAASGSRQRFNSGQRSSSSTISESSLPAVSPTGGREQSQVRCVCNRPDAGDGVFLIKCDSCDCLLHGRCVDVPTPQDLPHVYICAFCANTPNMRGGRMRHTGRTNAGDGVRGGRGLATGAPVPSSAASAAAAAIASSPLAHKSFRSFR